MKKPTIDQVLRMISGSLITIVVLYLMNVDQTTSSSGSFVILKESGQVEMKEQKLFYYPSTYNLTTEQLKALVTVSELFEETIILPTK